MMGYCLYVVGTKRRASEYNKVYYVVGKRGAKVSLIESTDIKTLKRVWSQGEVACKTVPR